MHQAKKEAIEKGEKFYFTGVPCIKGHLEKRRVINNVCLKCESERGFKDYHSKPQYKETRKKYRERMAGYMHQYWISGRGKFQGYKGRATRKGFEFTLTEIQFNNLIAQNCAYCGQDGGGIDRINSSIGYTLENSAPCCKQCNTAKMTQTVEQFLEWAERLVNYQRTKKC